MLSLTLVELLDAPGSEESRVLLAALAELLRGERGSACAAYADRRASERQALTALRNYAWAAFSDSASRADGLWVATAAARGLATNPIDRGRWVVTFPARMALPEPLILLDAGQLVDACVEVDRRWPMSPWWVEVRVNQGLGRV